MLHRQWRRIVVVLLVLAAVGGSLSTSPAPARPPVPADGTFGTTGLTGSGPVMQPVNVAARVARVAYEPGRDGAEAWAIGRVTAYLPSWPDTGSGTTVFLHFDTLHGWDVTGPPRGPNGDFVNLALANMAVARDGEGWAVGSAGTLVHHAPGGEWQVVDACRAGLTCSDLTSVSLVGDGDALRGFAVGAGGTILRLAHGQWQRDSAAVDPQNTGIDLAAVSASSPYDAWAVSGASVRELNIFHREGNVWTRRRTGNVLFDGPNPSAHTGSGESNLAAMGTAVSVAPDGTVWFGGGIYPLNVTKPTGDGVAGGSERPFTIQFDGTRFVTYCPTDYTLIAVATGETAQFCDHAMPIAANDITSIAPLPNGEVFAGGLGLFHFRKGGWAREPDAVGYLSSIAFATPDEGWVASSGDTVGAVTAVSTSFTIGHYTSHPARPALARWSQPNEQVLQDVAIAADGRALAVGNSGTTLLYKPGLGWDVLLRRVVGDLHAVGWSGPNDAWAVGQLGAVVHFDGQRFAEDEAAERVTSRSLFGLAFPSPGRGFAVGAGGTILRLDEGRWSADPASGRLTRSDLYSAAAVGRGVVAVGANGTVLVNPSGESNDWHIDPAVATMTTRRGSTPTLWSVAGLPDGTAVVGGDRGVVLRRDPNGSWIPFGEPLDGNIVALDVSRDRRGQLRVEVADSPAMPKFVGDQVSTSGAWIFDWDGERWRDVELAHRITINLVQDRGAARDPVLAVALEPGTARGWAVGGTRANLPDSEGHLGVTPTSSIYRIDVDGSPTQPGTEVTPAPSPSGFSFAFYSETTCGSGLCSSTVGSGTAADVVAQAIQNDINGFAALPNGPRFVLFGGDSRIAGIPEELGQLQGYLARSSIPVFGAMGAHDLFSPITGSVAVPPGFGDAYNGTKGVDRSAAPANRFFLQALANQVAPWGTTGARQSEFVPVELGTAAQPGLARTHYAFDYAPGGKKLARFIVLDTSDGSLRQSTNPQGQNPNEDQVVWLNAVLTDAKAQTPPLATILMMNAPTSDPTTSVGGPVLSPADGKAVESAATSFGVSVVLTGFLRANSYYYVPNDAAPVKVPFIVGGGGGAPIDGSHYPEDGHYAGWQLITVESGGVSLTQPQAAVTVRTMPVLESLALHAVDGATVAGGRGLHFEALGRAPDGGGNPADPNQVRRTYLHLPLPPVCPDVGPGNGTCFGRRALRPDYHFVSEDPSIAAFVTENRGNPGTPLVLANGLQPDDQSGFLCTFKAGTVYIDVVSGFRRARMPITVAGGEGPCVKHPVIAPAQPPAPALAEPAAAPIVKPSPVVAKFHPPTQVPDLSAVVLPPSPPPVAAPAPPASAAGARKEEKEYEHQMEGQEGTEADRAHFAAVQHPVRDPVDGFAWWLAASFIFAASLVGGTVLTTRRAPVGARVFPGRQR